MALRISDKRGFTHEEFGQVRGGLIGGTVGDALGYAVEFCAGETFRSVMASMAFGHLVWTLKAE